MVGYASYSQDQLSLIPGAQETMTTSGDLGGDVSCLLVCLRSFDSSEGHLKVVCNLLWVFPFLCWLTISWRFSMLMVMHERNGIRVDKIMK